MTPLESIIRKKIEQDGPIPFHEYMELCLFHPEHGYYNTHDPLRDFATAPEISQLFGEMIALWCIDCWMKMGSPPAFTLLECGPGRGTLMADILRTLKMAPDVLNAAQVHLLEKSSYLIAKQKDALSSHHAEWINGLADLPPQKTIMVCNEFFDAFPAQPFVKTSSGWAERAIAVEKGELVYVKLKTRPEYQHYFTDNLFKDAPVGAIAELNQPANEWVRDFSAHLKSHGGAALIIDYGYAGPELANTMQAIYQKKMSPVLKHPGFADITVHVDFSPFESTAQETGIMASPLTTMRDFLITCGIMLRADQLKAKASDEQQEALDKGLKRLIDKDQMGHLFKTLCLYHGLIAPPIGCES